MSHHENLIFLKNRPRLKHKHQRPAASLSRSMLSSRQLSHLHVCMSVTQHLDSKDTCSTQAPRRAAWPASNSFLSSPDLCIAATSSPPPTHFPSTKTTGTVRIPVRCLRAADILCDSDACILSNSNTSNFTPSLSRAAFALAQYGHQLFEKTATRLSLMMLRTRSCAGTCTRASVEAKPLGTTQSGHASVGIASCLGAALAAENGCAIKHSINPAVANTRGNVQLSTPGSSCSRACRETECTRLRLLPHPCGRGTKAQCPNSMEKIASVEHIAARPRE